MSSTSPKYYHHPVLSKSGYINYKYYSYPCPESKSWSVLEDALKINIPRIYNAVNKDPNSTPDLKKKVSNLYDDLHRMNSISSHTVSTKSTPLVGMDDANKKVYEIARTEGWEAAANHMLKGRTYSEMRAMYG